MKYQVRILIGFSVILIFLNLLQLSVYGDLKEENSQLKVDMENKVCFIDSVNLAKELKELRDFNYVYNRFKIYNRKIDTSTVNKFIEVSKYYNLDTTNLIFDYSISQICLESGAKQFDHEGNVIKSSGNAIGITQIVPTTAFSFLRYQLTDKEKSEFRKLGATDFSFVYPHKKTKKVRTQVIEWLSNETNNLILWGYIMRYSLKKRNYDVINSLIAYNGGDSFLRKYLKAGKDPNDFEYIVMIKGIMKKLNQKMDNENL